MTPNSPALLFQVLKRMGLGFGLERGQVSAEDLARARQMVPRALEQYVTQLAEKGPCATNGMPQVSDPVVLKQPSELSTPVVTGPGGGEARKRSVDEEDADEEESDIDVN